MIQVNLKTIKKGDEVFYIPRYTEFKKERGVVSSKNDRYVFVKYDGNFTAQATNPEDLFIEDK